MKGLLVGQIAIRMPGDITLEFCSKMRKKSIHCKVCHKEIKHIQAQVFFRTKLFKKNINKTWSALNTIPGDFNEIFCEKCYSDFLKKIVNFYDAKQS
jgi:hypothetical protein